MTKEAREALESLEKGYGYEYEIEHDAPAAEVIEAALDRLDELGEQDKRSLAFFTAKETIIENMGADLAAAKERIAELEKSVDHWTSELHKVAKLLSEAKWTEWLDKEVEGEDD